MLVTRYTLLTQDDYEISRIRNGSREPVTTTQIDNNANFLVVYIKYRNVQGMPFADDPPRFYAIGDLPPPRGPSARIVSPVTASEDANLSKGFSYAEVEPRATKQPRR